MANSPFTSSVGLAPSEINRLKTDASTALDNDQIMVFLDKLEVLDGLRVPVFEFVPSVVKCLGSKERNLREKTYSLLLSILKPNDDIVIMCISCVLQDLRSNDVALKALSMDFTFKLVEPQIMDSLVRDVVAMAKQPDLEASLKIKAVMLLSKYVRGTQAIPEIHVIAKQAQNEKQANVIMAYLYLFEDCADVSLKSLFSTLSCLSHWTEREESQIIQKSTFLLTRAIQTEPRIGEKLAAKVADLLKHFEPTETHALLTKFAIDNLSAMPAVQEALILSIQRHLVSSRKRVLKVVFLSLIEHFEGDSLGANQLQPILDSKEIDQQVKAKFLLVIQKVQNEATLSRFLEILSQGYQKRKSCVLKTVVSRKLELVAKALKALSNDGFKHSFKDAEISILKNLLKTNVKSQPLIDFVIEISRFDDSLLVKLFETPNLGRMLANTQILEKFTFQILNFPIDRSAIQKNEICAEIEAFLENFQQSDAHVTGRRILSKWVLNLLSDRKIENQNISSFDQLQSLVIQHLFACHSNAQSAHRTTIVAEKPNNTPIS